MVWNFMSHQGDTLIQGKWNLQLKLSYYLSIMSKDKYIWDFPKTVQITDLLPERVRLLHPG